MREFLSESAEFCPVCVAEFKVLAVASAGHHLILRRCGPDLTVGATHSADFLNPRCGWGNWDLLIETAPGGSDLLALNYTMGGSKTLTPPYVRVTPTIGVAYVFVNRHTCHLRFFRRCHGCNREDRPRYTTDV